MPHHGALLPSDHDMFFPFMLEDEVAGNAMEFESSQVRNSVVQQNIALLAAPYLQKCGLCIFECVET
jgi:hypothetical protein